MSGSPDTSNKNQPNIVSGLARGFAWIAIFWERIWPLLVPVFLVAIVFVSLSWVGLWENLSIWAHGLLLALIGVGAIISLWPLRLMLIPQSDEVLRRIEIESELEHRPISAQKDELVSGKDDTLSNALWREHRAQMAQQMHDLSSGSPKARGDRFDPFGLRLFLPILAFVAFMFSTGIGGGHIQDAFRFGGDPVKLLTRLDIWVNPPDYTRKAPLYLSVEGVHQQGQSILVPQFSKLAARFAGEGELSLQFNDGETLSEIPLSTEASIKNGDNLERIYSYKLEKSGVVYVYSGDTKIAEWSLEIKPDKVPEIKFAAEPGASLAGSLQLSYEVKDDYGVKNAIGLVDPVTNGTDEFDRDAPARFIPPANARSLIRPLEIKLPLPRRRAKSGTAKLNRDLSKHPLAGSLVTLKLRVLDDAGQNGFSESRELVLPGRRFSNPVSRALVEQRRILALDANQQWFVLTLLDSLTIAPEKFVDDYAAHMAIQIAYRRLASAKSDDDLRDVMDLMWEVALGIEFGKLSSAEQRLRDAQERLSEALENGASDEEISKLMNELRQAMNEMMQALSEQARQNPQAQNPLMRNEQARTLRQRDLQKMLDQIENLAKSGSKDAARKLLSEMQRMMDNLRAGRHMQQRQTEGNQSNNALNKLGDLMEKQQKLMEETFRMDQNERQRGENQTPQNRQNDQQNQNQGENQQQQNPNGDNQENSAQEYADALKQLSEQQKALRDQLNALNQQLEELGLQPTGEFNDAAEQMGKAGKQLGQGEANDATGSQGKALDALRRGAQSMMRQMAGDRQQGGERQGTGSTQQDSRMRRDPLGRGRNSQGADFGDDTKVPGEIEAQRAREILEAIRERLSKPQQRAIEKQYLERLLDSR